MNLDGGFYSGLPPFQNLKIRILSIRQITNAGLNFEPSIQIICIKIHFTSLPFGHSGLRSNKKNLKGNLLHKPQCWAQRLFWNEIFFSKIVIFFSIFNPLCASSAFVSGSTMKRVPFFPRLPIL